ncbi:MAG: hypothetical protein JF604_25310 [Bradyrhizobium sp.]|nr:hypothetical protein [Bradyrhizobium sp.]
MLPKGLSENTLQKLLNDNALETYPRLRDGGMIEQNPKTKNNETIR